MAGSSTYVLGQSDFEYRRLMMQASILRPWTDRFFRMAGVGTGMSVLDVGSGAGDVSLLAAEIVGPGGRVLGIERDRQGVELARRRTNQNACEDRVRFEQVDLDAFETDERFDALVGRYILLYQADASAAIRRLSKFLKPGGIVVFHEVDFTNTNSSWPPCAEWDLHYALLGEIFRKADSPPDFGRRLGNVFLDAGLRWPVLEAIGACGGGSGSYLYTWLATTLISLLPRLPELGVVQPAGVRIDANLSEWLRQSAVRDGSQILGPIQYGAWTRIAGEG